MDYFQLKPSTNQPSPQDVLRAGARTAPVLALQEILLRRRAVAYQRLMGAADFGTMKHAQGMLQDIDDILRMTTDGV